MYKIDLKTKKILYELDKNSRISLSQISKKVHLPKSVIAYRIKKLEEQGIIKNFYTKINFYKLGYFNMACYINLQYYTPRLEKEIIEYFVNNNLSWQVANIQGKFDLVVLFLINDIKKFFSFWMDTLKKYRYYFQDSIISFVPRTHYYLNSFLIDDYNKNDRKKYVISDGGLKETIDDKDIQILKLISLNARKPIVEIAEKIDSSTTMVSYRIKNLKKKEIIQGFRVNLDYIKLGYQFFNVKIGLKNYDKIKDIINYVKFNPHLIRINEVINDCDLSLDFLLRNFHELHPIINDIFNKFPNDVKNHMTFTYPEIYKSNYLPYDFRKK